ncbi:MAG: PhoH family protein [Bacteroidetes bacterium]|nr:MAG: PhoH family protein [Bacteroidota bacterium]REK00076.1 MAG: PhoH family protein [Bacteroidota bacterium]REK35920.1 MAG: PhoH family protein [Bacteroidota bacterium]REK50706.1 MAG: PhoH family protein [Bacteroidota bacterium]
MNEVIIPIDTFNPVEFFGVNDSNLEVIRKNFPELKLVARGNEIKVIGDEKNIHLFSEKINRLIQHYQKFGSLTPDNVEHFLAEKKGSEKAPPVPASDVLVFGQNGIMVRARTPNQKKMVESSEKNDIVFAIGPAGTGKTYTAVALAVRALKNREIKRIILTRPAVEAGENLGFLPGDLKEKIDPYLRPLYDALYDMIQGEKVKSYVETGIIEVAPLAFMRGRTLDNAFVILDEAQNATESQLKMFLTRMGPSAKFIVTGDVTQIDLPRNQPSGLVQAIKILSNIKGVDFIYLDAQDVVRHRLVKEIIEAYNR